MKNLPLAMTLFLWLCLCHTVCVISTQICRFCRNPSERNYTGIGAEKCSLLIYSLDKLKPKTKTKIFFVNNISTLLYTLKKKTFLPFCFLVPPFKVYKKVVKFSFTPAKNILVVSFSFWFQLLFRIYFLICKVTEVL